MSRAPELVIAIQSILVALAVIVNFVAYRRGLNEWRAQHLATSCLACIYLAGHLWLVAAHVDRQLWSEVMVGVGFVSWPVVWMSPGVLSIRSNRPIRRLRNKVAEYEEGDKLSRLASEDEGAD